MIMWFLTNAYVFSFSVYMWFACVTNREGVGFWIYFVSCFEYLIQSSQSINDFDIFWTLISKCRFALSLCESAIAGSKHLRNMYIEHEYSCEDGNKMDAWQKFRKTKKKKKSRTWIAKHVWGGNRILNSVPMSAMWNPSALCTKTVSYLYIYIHV